MWMSSFPKENTKPYIYDVLNRFASRHLYLICFSVYRTKNIVYLNIFLTFIFNHGSISKLKGSGQDVWISDRIATQVSDDH